MKLLNYLLFGFILIGFLTSCNNQSNDTVFADGKYCFVEDKGDDEELFLKEYILTIKDSVITGTVNTWFEEGDHEFIGLAELTMSEGIVKGYTKGTSLVLLEKETEYGGDFPDDYVFKFSDPETWNWDGEYLTHSKKVIKMKKVHEMELPSYMYRKFDTAKIVH